jgi:hypothetical protein
VGRAGLVQAAWSGSAVWEAGEPGAAPPIVREALESSGEPLPPTPRAFLEARLGHDFSRVRVHADARAAEAARSVGALAYTTGEHVVFGAGRYAPETAAGRRLLAHELTHVVQQEAGGVPSRPRIQREAGAAAPSNRVTLTFPNGRTETRLLIRACSNGLLSFYPQGQAHISAFRSIAFSGGVLQPGQSAWTDYLRFIRATHVVPQRCGVAAASCPCDSSTQETYDQRTLGFIGSIRSTINRASRAEGVPANAVAGGIADEYRTRRGIKAVVDAAQDAIIGSLPEFAIDIDRYFDIHSKLFNTLENDIGPANIKVRTALELVQRGELRVPGSPPSDIQVNRIVSFLLTEQGTVQAAAAVIHRGQTLFGTALHGYRTDLSEAVLVEYFKQGEIYYTRFSRVYGAFPDHRPCPGDGGCRFLHNRAGIGTALTPRPGVVRTSPGTSMVVPDVEAWERAVQRKAIGGEPGDPFEREAEDAEQELMEAKSSADGIPLLVQRQTPPEGGEAPEAAETGKTSGSTLTYDEVKAVVESNNQSSVSTGLLICLIWKESGFKPGVKNAKSSATGLMQMTKGAVTEVNKNTPSDVHFEHSEMTDAAKNVDCGSRYLALRIKWAKGDVTKGLEGFGTGAGYADALLVCEGCLGKAPADATTCLNKIHR